ncbi:MAG: PspC domain-containing protein [Anaerolineae bacterium]|nr:PspC domain-containing protein [Anaerolineae bacterium]MCA9887746.1 PspC domain-containing protein [Anaerolineae bacterium]MCA9894804.1 PspC domain-containing protein [Anaerolineae bacterium]MCB9459434.1 PspC domain-containing protein [Anaerolineaceae bacterium]
MNNERKRLYRSQSDRQVAGVCGGLAEYFNVDSTLVRIVFLLLFFGMGNGFILYLVLWMVMPEESDVRAMSGEKRKNDDMYEDLV